jgi:hypothetical protein
MKLTDFTLNSGPEGRSQLDIATDLKLNAHVLLIHAKSPL